MTTGRIEGGWPPEEWAGSANTVSRRMTLWWRRQPLERKLPAVFTLLIAVMAMCYTIALYRAVQRNASESVGQRLNQVGSEIAGLLAANDLQRHTAIVHLSDSAGASDAVILLAAKQIPVVLLDSAGSIRSQAGPPVRAAASAQLQQELALATAKDGIVAGRLFVVNDSVYYWSYTGVRGGIIAQRQQIRSQSNARPGALEKLIGETSVLIANRDGGAGPWVEIQGRRVDPATSHTVGAHGETHMRGDTVYLTRYTPVPRSAWSIVTETPQSITAARAAEFAGETLPLTIGFIVIGGILAWLTGHRVTRPVRQLANAALAIGSGDYNRRVHVREGGDLGMMARSFNRMAVEVERSKAEMEERVRQRTAELEVVNNELQAFSYSVSHDLRSPLRSIDGFSQALLEDYSESLDPTAQDYLRRVRGGAQRMGRLIDDLLLLSRVTRQPVEPTVVSVSTIASEVVDDLRTQEPHRHVSVCIEEGIEVRGDEGLMRVVMQNLIGNAWKFTSNVDKAVITVASARDGAERIVFVRDNGAGFDMEHAQQLFSPFQRLHSTTQFGGTGIGLATVYRAMKRQGGRVWADATVGNGATFFIAMEEA